jgi:hypothetical protein
MMVRKLAGSVISALAILSSSVTLLLAADGIISKVPDGSGSSCSLTFPAIKESTLYWPRPVLKDPASGDIVSYYGDCNHDPLGPQEIRRQRIQYQNAQRRLPEGE